MCHQSSSNGMMTYHLRITFENKNLKSKAFLFTNYLDCPLMFTLFRWMCAAFTSHISSIINWKITAYNKHWCNFKWNPFHNYNRPSLFRQKNTTTIIGFWQQHKAIRKQCMLIPLVNLKYFALTKKKKLSNPTWEERSIWQWHNWEIFSVHQISHMFLLNKWLKWEEITPWRIWQLTRARVQVLSSSIFRFSSHYELVSYQCSQFRQSSQINSFKEEGKNTQPKENSV